MSRSPTHRLETPSDPELRRQMEKAVAEAASARRWLSFVRLVLGGSVAIMSGALAGAVLWVVSGVQTDLPAFPDLGPPLLTAGGDEGEAEDAPIPEPSGPIPNVMAPETLDPEALPDPQDVPILVPDESLQFSWTEEPPILADDPLADLIEQQDLDLNQAGETGSAGLGEAEPSPLLSKPSAGQIDAALAALDLDSLRPAEVVAESPPAWRRNAVAVAKPFDGPVIALVIDDLGLNRTKTQRTIALPGPLTLALMTYAEGLEDYAAAARAQGHELLVHVPMAPRDPQYDPGPNALQADLGAEELARRLTWGLSRFEGFVGINNHMGSGFTTSIEGMAQVMMELKARGLLYLDSLTVPGAVGAPLADRLGVPFAVRDVFIDNDYQDRESIRRQLQRLERIALRRGGAIGIGHPHAATLEELAIWLPEVQRRGFTLVPVSALMRQPSGLAVKPEGADNSPG